MSTANDPNEAMKAIQQAMQSMDSLGSTAAKNNSSPQKTTLKSVENSTNNHSSAKKPLQHSKKSNAKIPSKTGFLSFFKRFVKGTIGLAVFLAVSPILLVKGAMWLHLQEGLNSYLSLGVSAIAAILASSLIVSIYLAIFIKKAYFKTVLKTLGTGWIIVMIPLMLFGGLINSKNQAISGEFASAHPILKMAVSTYALFDRDVVMTDVSRAPADYEKMGLTPKQYSKHFVQNDGHVHAIDLRTIGRPEWQNTLAAYAFKFMGFKTLRHIGTADHLHISL